MITHPPVVLVHGVGLSADMWNGVAAHLGVDRQIIAYDMLGHGTLWANGASTFDRFVDQLAEVVDRAARGGRGVESGAGGVDVVGFSMGALVAQGFAARQPGSLHRLALLHAVFDRTPAERAAIVERVAHVRDGGFVASIPVALERWFTPEFAAARPEVVDGIRSMLEANDIEAYANAYEVFATADADLVKTVGCIRCPTLVMTGVDDPRSTPGMTERLAALLMHGESVVLPGLRHLAPVEEPALVSRELRSFLDRTDT